MNKQILKLFSIFILLYIFLVVGASNTSAYFRFVAWGDTKSGTSVLARLSNQIKAMSTQPVFTLYGGDLISSGSTIDLYQTWGNYLNGSSNNGMLNKTFAVRGNHDSSAAAAFAQYFQFGPESDTTSISAKVGATHYSALTTDLTYSFDYQNAHFVGIDLPGGDVSSMPTASITWLDQDLTAAENRGLKHAFLFWHGPIYYADGHSSTAPASLITVLNKHAIISASFHGHEHIDAYTKLTSTRIPSLTKIIEQFVIGNAGAGAYTCTAGRSDYCQNYYGFSAVDVLSDTQFTVTIYKDGITTPQWQQTFTKSSTNQSPTVTPRLTQNITATPRLTITPTPITIGGDVDHDGHINIIDFQLLSNSFGKSSGQSGFNSGADFNNDNMVNILDFQVLSNNFGR